MILRAETFAKQSVAFVVNAFFSLAKAGIILLGLVVLALGAGQSTFAPVSVRLLTFYAVKYAVAAAKPCRPYFPQPYSVDFEKH